MLAEVKTALRISHNALDDEIDDLITAARYDLKLSGISSVKADEETDIDPLIKRAIITYVKVNFVSNANDASRFQMSYELLKRHLSLAGDYQEGEVIG